jgi:hypothetical protein
MKVLRLIVLVAGLVGAATPGHAFLFLLAAGAGQEKVKPPPILRELPPLNTDKEIRPSGLPAPYLLSPQNRAMPALPDRLAQASPQDLQDLRRRLDQLEEENRRLRGQGGAGASTAAPRDGLPGARLPAQVTSGWWVHLHQFNKDGNLGAGPTRTFRYDQQEFNTTIGFRETNATQWSEIFIYRFEAWLRVKEAGTHQIGAVLNCPFEHPCNYSVSLDGIRLAEFTGQHSGTANQLVFGARHLPVGDYRMEMVFFIPRTSFLKYRPHAVTMHPKVRTVADMNFRDFGSDELLIPDRRDVPIGPAMQRPGGW